MGVSAVGVGERYLTIIRAKQACCACASEEEKRERVQAGTGTVKAPVHAAEQEAAGRDSTHDRREMATLTQKMPNRKNLNLSLFITGLVLGKNYTPLI